MSFLPAWLYELHQHPQAITLCYRECCGLTAAVNPWVALAYLVSGVFFILALRGLSSPATSRTGNRFGMIGMLIAVVTTLVTHFRNR